MDDERIAESVKKYGWNAISVSDHTPPFLYSIGLMPYGNHPELIVFGLESGEAHAILSAMIREIRIGKSFKEPGVYSLAQDFSIGIRCVDETQHPLYLGYAMGYCRRMGRIGELQAVQVFWPDKNGKFPFDVGCDLEVYQSQPRLDLALTPSEIQEFERKSGYRHPSSEL
jgi:hypothetical protein